MKYGKEMTKGPTIYKMKDGQPGLVGPQLKDPKSCFIPQLVEIIQ